MKRILLIVFFIGGFFFPVHSQPKAVEGMAEFQGKKVPAAVLELPYSADKVEEAIAEKMASKGHKGTKSKDYQLYRSVSIGNEKTPYDMYIKAEKKSRKEKESSIVYVVLVKPNEAASADAVIAAGGIAEGKYLLNDYSSHVEDYNLRLEIAAQEEVIRKLEKKQSGLLSDSTDLVIKSKALEEKILANSNEMAQQRLELEKQRLNLEAIKARRKN
ncbi:hypothetical protein [Flavihumibacter fluvii]|uniref:hypothetical protein n=1 Tax=Flavihumibacter fluvii TaxID=2838157 RepID=UPI001BDDD9CA|nr:hypothetical protein [Flavihumibacter fluvii]ULQ51107.1 hypothetical protein KJS93_13545 [Flavihumibacter fluvii]